MSVLVYALALHIAAPCSAAAPIEAGDRAECSGLVVPQAQAVEAIECMRITLPACGNELETTKRKAAIEHKAFTAQIEALNTHIHVCERAVIEAAAIEQRAWWDSPAMGFGAGVLVTAATVVALLFGQK